MNDSMTHETTPTVPDQIRVDRPDGLADDEWTALKERITDKLEVMMGRALMADGVRGGRPMWSNPALDDVQRGKDDHPDDRGVWIRGVVDEWIAEERDQDGRVWRKRVVVQMDGFRHDNTPENDWDDRVTVDIEDPDGTRPALSNASDVRRLMAALDVAAGWLDAGGRL